MTACHTAKYIGFMAEPITEKQLLAGLLLGRPLAEYVAEKRAVERPRWSWQNIADQLEADTANKITVTGESLRLWYGVNDEAVA